MTKKFVVAALVMVLMTLSAIAVMAAPNASPATPYREQVITNSEPSYIVAVWFDAGQGLDMSPSGTHDVRPGEDTNTEVGGSRFGGNVAWTLPGEWMQYTVTVEDADTYRVYAYLAAYPTPPGNIRVYVDNEFVGQSQSTDSSGWQAYRWHFVGEVDLTPGESVIVVYIVSDATAVTSGVTNFAALRFDGSGAPAPTATPTPAEANDDSDAAPTPPVVPPPPPAGDDAVLRFAVGSTTYTINGVAGTLDAAPFNQDGRVMVPLRQIGEAIGAAVIAFEDNTAIIDNIRLPIGVALAGGMGTPVIVDGRTFVPLGYIAGRIGATPRWDGAASAAYIYIGEAPTPPPAPPTPAAAPTPTPAAAPPTAANVQWRMSDHIQGWRDAEAGDTVSHYLYDHPWSHIVWFGGGGDGMTSLRFTEDNAIRLEKTHDGFDHGLIYVLPSNAAVGNVVRFYFNIVSASAGGNGILGRSIGPDLSNYAQFTVPAGMPQAWELVLGTSHVIEWVLTAECLTRPYVHISARNGQRVVMDVTEITFG
ncbi:MAG: stalk domain-containing protein [Defluviitaleaceae bacterium]|nr:stalk domain-containing protein [Defluviitaleaceae bacterium]